MKQQPNPASQQEDKMETEGERWKWTQKAREAQQFAIGGSTSLKQECSDSWWEQTHSSVIMNTYTGLREGWSSKFLLRNSIYVKELQENKGFGVKQSCYTIFTSRKV